MMIRNLLEYNTMKMDVDCRGIIPIYSENNIYETLVSGKAPLKIIGGGSNILLTEDLDHYVLLNQIKGIEIIDEDDETVLVKVGAGENWHQFVMWAISHNLGGIENLALIPGCVGAAPMQNIGAYGVEQESTFHSLHAIHLVQGTGKTFYKEDCKFGYRESIFKNEVKDQYIITHVNYILNKKHKLNTNYGAITAKLAEREIHEPSISDVASAIIEIRQSKLPDPKVIPNTGSFFKNPIIKRSLLTEVQASYPDIVFYDIDDAQVKIPAAWLIQHAGLKGIRQGDAGTHKNHALVLVNYGKASGSEMLNLADHIQKTVLSKFGIEIVPEVNVW